MINKKLLLDEIIKTLEALYQDAFDAAMRAYDTATDNGNEAENKYDTLGLEAAYLAHGQSKRVAECAVDLNTFKKLKEFEADSRKIIKIGTLIYLVDSDDNKFVVFLGPAAGGLNVTFEETNIAIVTAAAPLGNALLGRFIDDEFELKLGHIKKHYTITDIC